MHLLKSPRTRLFLVAGLLGITLLLGQSRSQGRPFAQPTPLHPASAGAARIEAVFVLDTTGSMGGLLEGAKQKIWSIASQLAGARQQTDLRIGLVAYRDRGDDYVTRFHDLTGDLDAIYAQLQSLQAAGGGDGPESVNQALHEALVRPGWSAGDGVYRVIFLVGDAPPHMDYQDDVPWPESVRLAGQRGIVVNTIQCGSMGGTTKVWKALARGGQGRYAAIAPDGGMLAIATPMDDELVRLNRALSATVVPYGAAPAREEMADKARRAAAAPPEAAADRLSYLKKAGRGVLAGTSDLVEAVASGLVLDSVAEQQLPKALQALPPGKRSGYLEEKRAQRARLKKRIDTLTGKRDDFVAKENRRRLRAGEAGGFDTEVFETIKSQAARRGIHYD